MSNIFSFFKLPATYLIFALSWLFIIASSTLHGRIEGRDVRSFIVPFIVGGIFAAILAHLNFLLERKKKNEKFFLLQVIESLAMALDERDQYTHGHARRVTCLSLILQEAIDAPTSSTEILRLSAILHDIGKVGIPDSILLKPGRLSDEEFAQIKKHPEQGCHILQPMGLDGKIHDVIKNIRHHHERYDGQGYPDGLAGEEIPLLSRIIAIADSFDAMTSDRPYRQGMSLPQALSEIKNGIGTQFDPKLCEVFLKLYEDVPDACCPNMLTCPIFEKIENRTIIKAYESQYCRFFFQSCARHKIKNDTLRPQNLLPDGSFLALPTKENR